MSYGPRPDELAHAASIGLTGWVEEQLAPEQIDDQALEWRIQSLDALFLDTSILFEIRRDEAQRQLQQATLLRAIYSRRQLYEQLVEFWSDHFTISIDKGACAWLKLPDDREVIRRHAMGSFPELLWASLNSPAMLYYLDNQENHAGAPNENYARELLELHSLGVNAGYDQQDVQEAARCLTGWGIDEGLFRGQQRFFAGKHDDGPKHLLGVTIPAGGGARDIEQLHAAIVAHPALPGFIARKLVCRFIADEPPTPLIRAAATAFQQSRGDIRATIRAIVLGPGLEQAAPKFKRPLHFVAGALRQLEAESDGGPSLLAALTLLGQPLFRWPSPDGFPEHTTHWRSALLPRWQFALRLTSDELPGARLTLPALRQPPPAADLPNWIDRLARRLLGAPLPAATTQAIARIFGPDKPAGIIAALLSSPEYQWR